LKPVMSPGAAGRCRALRWEAGGPAKVVISEPSRCRCALMEKMGFVAIDPAGG